MRSALSVNFSPFTSVRYKVSNWLLIAATTNLNPAPLVTFVLALSTVKTSPTWYPVPAPFITTFVTTSPDTVILHAAPLPFPVKEIVGTAVVLLNEYPDPPAISSGVAIGAPWPSTIPVILTSSASEGAPVLTFLPIGNLAFVLVPDPSILTINFLGSERIGLSIIFWVFSLPGSIGVL